MVARNTDVVVVGAGHNGLVAANYLVDGGFDVVVVERGPQIGGMTRSNYAIPEAPNHLINHCAVDPIFWTTSVAAKGLALEKHGLRYVAVDPAFVYLHPTGESIAFWTDPRKTADDIRRFSKRDAEAYLDFARLLAALLDLALPLFAANPLRPNPSALLGTARGAFRHRKRLAELAAFVIGSAGDAIGDRFEHPVVRSALHIAAGNVISSTYPGSSLQLVLLGLVHRDVCLRPVGGTQAIPNALAGRLTAAGGEVLTDALVDEVSVADGRVTGVVLADGREIRAKRAVLASCDPKQTLTQLVPSGPTSGDRGHTNPRICGLTCVNVGSARLGRVTTRPGSRGCGCQSADSPVGAKSR